MSWKNRPVLVTGGASFIGSHLVERLVSLGASIRVVDNLSSGKRHNLADLIESKEVEFIQGDLCEQDTVRAAVRGMDTIFHLAADHGGRGYVDLHQAGPASNLFLDGMVFREALRAKVERVVYASSGCVYPNHLQTDPDQELYLTEEMVGPPYDADNMYGWAKLMGEQTLKAYHQEHGLKAASCRYFTVYGPRGKEDHAVIAMIARAFLKQDPFEVWGDGTQIRNWTYVDDIVEGTVLAAEKIEDGTAVNLGTMERTRVVDAVRLVLEHTGHKAELKIRKDMPTGPRNRVADNSLAKKLLGFEPKLPFREGVPHTIDWYFANRKQDEVRANLDRILLER